MKSILKKILLFLTCAVFVFSAACVKKPSNGGAWTSGDPTGKDDGKSWSDVNDEEVESIIKKAHEQASELLKANKGVLDVMARVLVERETIYSDEVAMMMKGSTAEEIIKYMDENAEVEKNDPFRIRDKELGKALAEAENGSVKATESGDNKTETGAENQPKSEENKH